MKQPQLGLKLWSTNLGYIDIAGGLYADEIFDYVELFVVPDSTEDCLKRWGKTKFPFLLHAPHSQMGLNFSRPECEAQNRALLSEVEEFRKALDPEYVIFHPGVDGSLQETIRQIQDSQKEYPELFGISLIENKPKIGLKAEVCLGAAPEEIAQVLAETGLGFCLDFGHAICYAAWRKAAYESVVDQFLKFEPNVYHLSDGDVRSKTDAHLNFGKGNFELARIIGKIPARAYVSIETNKSSPSSLGDFEKDVAYFRSVSDAVKV